MAGRPETDYSAEADAGSTEGSDELDRTAKEAKARDSKRSKAILVDVINSQVKLTAEIATMVGHLNNVIARDALAPKLVEHSAEIVADTTTGATELKALTAKVDKLLKAADTTDKNNGNGASKEGKFSKLAAASAALVGALPFMQDLYQLLVKASSGALSAGDIADAGNRAAVMALMLKWRNESDADYWKDFADFYQVHNAGSALANVGSVPKEDPTAADLCLILNMTSRMFPVSSSQPFTWPTAKAKADAVTTLSASFDPSSLSGKVSFIASLASLKSGTATLPRGIQAEIGALAVADKIS